MALTPESGHGLRPTDSELLAHRAMISKTQPSLTQSAGKAVTKLALFRDRLDVHHVASHPKKGATYEVRLLTQVNLEIDPKVVDKILIEIANERGREIAHLDHAH